MTEYKDIESINFWKKSRELYGNDPRRLAEERKVLEKKARDHARSPFPSSERKNGGFCESSVKPWMRVNDDYKDVNAEKQQAADNEEELSTWQFWQRGLANRKAHSDCFVYGDFHAVGPESDEVFAYVRLGKKSGKWLVVLNFSRKEVEWDIPNELRVEGWMAGNYLKGKPDKKLEGSVSLRPWEGILGKCVN